MRSDIQPELPPLVQDAFGLDNISSITRLSGGLVNETVFVEAADRKLILRKLAPIIGTNIIRTIDIVGEHLASSGWEAPLIERTNNGQTYVLDESQRLWHGMNYIESDCSKIPQPSVELAQQVGELLGRWHGTVRPLEYTPDSLPHFHDTNYIASKLTVEVPLLPTEAMQDLATKFLADHDYGENQYDDSTFQIIHGDPKLDNMLYRENKPFTLIDFDCVMVDSIWTDIGDFLRSLNGKLIDTGEDPFKAVTGFMEAYLESTDQQLSFDEATFYALQATRRITRELGMRYLSDIVDGQQYFSWDKSQYSSRSEALFNKAVTQFEILQITQSYLNEGAC